MLPGAEHVVEVLHLLGVHRPEHLLEERLGEADDRVERRPQLVRHRREELRLVSARDLELAALLLDLAEEVDVLDRDRGLIGEGLDQPRFLVGKGPHDLSRQGDRSNDPALGDHRQHEHRPCPDRVSSPRIREVGIRRPDEPRIGIDADRRELLQPV